MQVDTNYGALGTTSNTTTSTNVEGPSFPETVIVIVVTGSDCTGDGSAFENNSSNSCNNNENQELQMDGTCVDDPVAGNAGAVSWWRSMLAVGNILIVGAVLVILFRLFPESKRHTSNMSASSTSTMSPLYMSYST
jgi:hypothetical protein